MTQHTAKLHVLRETNLLDIPAMLRVLADDIEKGEYGHVHGCAFVLDADPVRPFYWGSGEAGPNGFLLLHAGAAKVMATVLEGGT